MKIQSIAANDRDVAERDVVGDAIGPKRLFAGPFIDAAGARAIAAKLCGSVRRFSIVRPFDRDLAVRFFDYLCWFDHDGYIPW